MYTVVVTLSPIPELKEGRGARVPATGREGGVPAVHEADQGGKMGKDLEEAGVVRITQQEGLVDGRSLLQGEVRVNNGAAM